MIYKCSVIEVKIRLDPVSGWGHEPEDHVRYIQQILKETISHYEPEVKLLRVEG